MGRIKSEIVDESQEKAVVEVLLILEDKRLAKTVPNPSDRVEVLKTIMNRARDIEKEVKRVTLTREEPDMTQYDVLNRLWKACGFCGAVDINQITDGKEWQGCFCCRHLLNEDGTTRKMTR